MKKYVLMVLGLLCGSVALAQRVAPSSESLRVNLLMGDKSTVSVRSVGNGTNEATCSRDAQIKAMKAVLFVGLSSPVTDKRYAPLVANESENEAYFTSFFDNDTYKRFVTVAVASSSLDKVKGQKQKEQSFDIAINIASLETTLRADKIIKRMGLQ